ncbi:MAG: (2Fe-2S) ferredoxin domain-containing protein [Calditrichaeota bacterium]|nr:MAG: (2Fe-2S) ferredoxin domain-containing protein [Calditrichota bacterium]
MSKYGKHVFICTNERPEGSPRGCCANQDSAEIQIKMKAELKKRGMSKQIRANKAGCLNFCEQGPVVVVYPEGTWYKGVSAEDVEEIVESHLINDEPVERLIFK